MILDACYSGAIAQGWRTKSVGVDIKKQLGAEGRVVLTSSSATQTSFEQEGLPLSLYTQYLVEGIETGAADTDNDGNIHVQELHAYAKAKVQAVKPKMTPEIILDKEGFNILLAHAPKNAEVEYRKLVEQYAQNGELSKLSYLILKPKRKTFGITDKQAKQIESEVLEPFRRRFANLESYKQAFVEEVEQKYPLDEHTRKILKDYQQDILGLRDEDVAQIELEIASIKEAEYQQRQREEAEKIAELQAKEKREREQEETERLRLQREQQEAAEQLQKQQEAQRLQLQREQQEAERLQRQKQKTDDLTSEKGVDYTKLRDLLAKSLPLALPFALPFALSIGLAITSVGEKECSLTKNVSPTKNSPSTSMLPTFHWGWWVLVLCVFVWGVGVLIVILESLLSRPNL